MGSHYGNEWENHRTEQDFQNALIYKSFCFKFVNSFASLFYLGFIRPAQNGVYYYVHFYQNVCADAAPFIDCVAGGDDGDEACIQYVLDPDNDNAAWSLAI